MELRSGCDATGSGSAAIRSFVCGEDAELWVGVLMYFETGVYRIITVYKNRSEYSHVAERGVREIRTE